MSNTTESYIILKPISERFNKIANEITDGEISYLIREALREQLSKVDFTSRVGEICEEWVEDNEDFVIKALQAGIEKKLNS